MNTHIKTWLGALIIIIMAITAGMFIWKVYEINTAYAPAPQTFQTPKPKVKENNVGMANPASVFCEQNGGKLEIITAEDGGQSGMCKFYDGSQCEEWAFQRGECKIGDSQKQLDTSDWQIYKNEKYGFEFKYPKDWELITYDNLLNDGRIVCLRSSQIQKLYNEKKIDPGYSEDFCVSYWLNINDEYARGGSSMEDKDCNSLEEFLSDKNKFRLKNKIGNTNIDNHVAYEIISGGAGTNYAIMFDYKGIYEIDFPISWDKSRMNNAQKQILSSFKFLK